MADRTRSRNRRIRPILLISLASIALAGITAYVGVISSRSEDRESGASPVSAPPQISPPEPDVVPQPNLNLPSHDPPAPDDLEIARVLRLGEMVFDQYCVECHGLLGDGDGVRNEISYALPRNFLTGTFKLTTTENLVPSDADLTRTIERGVPSAGMPNWGWLPEEEIAALVAYVRHLVIEARRDDLAEEVAKGELTAEVAAEILAEQTVPGPTIVVPPEPEFSPQRRLRGRSIYLEACSLCHGPEGEPDEGNFKTDFEGNLVLPTSLVKGDFKGGSEGAQLYARLLKGMNGTAMPAYEGAYSDEELWDLIHYVQSLAQPQAR